MPPAQRPGRLLGLYALSVMAREGPVHGYRLSERIAERTEGSWRPGAGAIYPALRRLAERGLARARRVGARRSYTITPAGRALLRQLTDRASGRSPPVPDTTVLWMEIVGESDRGRYLLRHLRRHLESAARYAEAEADLAAATAFRKEVGAEFERFDARAGARRDPRRRAGAAGARVRGRVLEGER